MLPKQSKLTNLATVETYFFPYASPKILVPSRQSGANECLVKF